MQNVEKLADELEICSDGKRVGQILDILVKRLSGNPPCAISKEALAKFYLSGSNEGQQSRCGFALAKSCAAGDVLLEQVFKAGINNAPTKHTSLLGLINVSRAGAYPELLDVALSTTANLEDRLYAIELLSLSSGQSFCRSISRDVSEWSVDQLPIAALIDWQKSGYPLGNGIAYPKRHPDLDNPKTDLHRAASALDKKLSAMRSSDPYSFVEAKSCLYYPDPDQVDLVTRRLNLPEEYFEFISKFSPLEVEFTLRGSAESSTLYGIDDIAAGQLGFSVNGITGELIEDWPSNYLVIAQRWGDPFVIDVSKHTDKVPVYYAKHGLGDWKFTRKYNSLVQFLESIAIAKWDGYRDVLPKVIRGLT